MLLMVLLPGGSVSNTPDCCYTDCAMLLKENQQNFTFYCSF
jgi:hypothetical protein